MTTTQENVLTLAYLLQDTLTHTHRVDKITFFVNEHSLLKMKPIKNIKTPDDCFSTKVKTERISCIHFVLIYSWKMSLALFRVLMDYLRLVISLISYTIVYGYSKFHSWTKIFLASTKCKLYWSQVFLAMWWLSHIFLAVANTDSEWGLNQLGKSGKNSSKRLFATRLYIQLYIYTFFSIAKYGHHSCNG